MFGKDIGTVIYSDGAHSAVWLYADGKIEFIPVEKQYLLLSPFETSPA